ncbi:MAG: Na+:solute symporter [Akkermansiaceae bacterium]|nr:Na+:solute symporter [Akkermansiaceae bacterium]
MSPTLASITLTSLDWSFIIGFFIIALGIGVYTSKQAGKSEADFFLGGRTMPWWLLGFSMVATTFSTDTPNLVTNLVRESGVSGNWCWWVFLLTGMLTVFVFSKIWRRSNLTTDVEFYEMRYSGKEAAFLRWFRSIYLGVFLNVMIMASVSLAAIKIGGIMLGLEPWECIVYAAGVTVIFSSLGGFKGVLLTDFLLFIIAMVGAVAAAYYALGHEAVGGLSGMLEKFSASSEMESKLNFFPQPGTEAFTSFLLIPLLIGWWSSWYPGAEPGGGGYLAQRMLAAKNEKHAVGATLFFNACHYAVRPWPWIIVALCSLIVFPDIESIKAAFPEAENVANDSAYSAMLTFLPTGWMGLVLTSLVAAYMSTISTHLNWGSSYIVNDVYLRFLKPNASQKELVWIGRISTVVLMIIAGVIALNMESAQKNFQLLLAIGAGTGSIYILRWFWWRVNAYSEIAGMLLATLNAVLFWKFDNFGLSGSMSLVASVAITTIGWIVVTLMTRPTDKATLRGFVKQTNPGGPGWQKIYREAQAEGEPIDFLHSESNIQRGLICMILACAAVYSFLFGTGYVLYGQSIAASICSIITIISSFLVYRIWFCADEK